MRAREPDFRGPRDRNLKPICASFSALIAHAGANDRLRVSNRFDMRPDVPQWRIHTARDRARKRIRNAKRPHDFCGKALREACRIPCTTHRTPHTVHRTPYTVYRTPYTVHHTPYDVHRIPYTVHRTPYTVNRPPQNAHHAPYTVHRIPCTAHRTPFTVHRASYTVRHIP